MLAKVLVRLSLVILGLTISAVSTAVIELWLPQKLVDFVVSLEVNLLIFTVILWIGWKAVDWMEGRISAEKIYRPR